MEGWNESHTPNAMEKEFHNRMRKYTQRIIVRLDKMLPRDLAYSTDIKKYSEDFK